MFKFLKNLLSGGKSGKEPGRSRPPLRPKTPATPQPRQTMPPKPSKARIVREDAGTHDDLKIIDASDRIVWIRDGRVSKIETKDEVEIDVGAMRQRATGKSAEEA